MYLANYGYLDPALKNNSSNALFLVSKEAYRHAIAEFQSLAGLEPTGKQYLIISMIHQPICPSWKLETLLLFNLSHSLIIRRYLG
jgi:hypothetical protein